MVQVKGMLAFEKVITIMIVILVLIAIVLFIMRIETLKDIFLNWLKSFK